MNKINYAHPMAKGGTCIFMLWLIGRKEMHGYQMIKLLKENGIGVGANRLYPLLNRMLADKMISQKEKKYGGRVRKVYVITTRGKQELKKGKKLFTGIIAEFVKEMLR